MATINWPRWLFAAGAAAEGGQGDERRSGNERRSPASLRRNIASSSWSEALADRRRRKCSCPRVGEWNAEAEAGCCVAQRELYACGVGTGRQAKRNRCGPFWTECTIQRLGFGKGPDGASLDQKISRPPGRSLLEVAIPEGSFAGELQVEAELVGFRRHVLRCVAVRHRRRSKGRPSWAAVVAIRRVPAI